MYIFASKIIKILTTDTIFIDIDFAVKYCARVRFIFYVILRRIPRSYPSLLWRRLPFCYFPSQFYFRATFLPLFPTCRESIVITVQSCCFSFIPESLFEKHPGSLRPSRFYTSAGGYMNSTTAR